MVLPPPTTEEIAPFQDITNQIEIYEPAFKEGGFSTVHTGIWTDGSSAPRYVAVKILRPTGGEPDDPELIKRRLNRESRVWHTIDHKYILKFLGVYQNQTRQISAMVSPLCSQGNVVDFLKTRTPENDVNRPLMIFRISQALEYLHSRNIVHGDLKGKNILVDDRGLPLIADFGRSKVIDSRGFTTAFSGTMRYMAPELLGPLDNMSAIDEFKATLTKESDVYGFGMVGLEILTGQKPFHRTTLETTLVIIVNQQGRKPDRPALAGNNSRTWDVLDRCWARNPASRPVISAVVQEMSKIVS